MRVLVACEFSGRVRDAFRRAGHEAWSCDIEPTETIGLHYQGDVLDILDDGWDLMVAHPPCTYLTRAGARWWRDPARQVLADDAAAFVFALRDAPIPRIAIENPIGQLTRRWRSPDQTIQPYQFGEPYSKATCLWLKNLPQLQATDIVTDYEHWLPANVGLGKRLGQKWHRGHSKTKKDRSRTFVGIADAMASQWSGLETTLELAA